MEIASTWLAKLDDTGTGVVNIECLVRVFSKLGFDEHKLKVIIQHSGAAKPDGVDYKMFLDWVNIKDNPLAENAQLVEGVSGRSCDDTKQDATTYKTKDVLSCSQAFPATSRQFEGTWILENMHSGWVLQVQGKAKSKRANVWQNRNEGTKACHWIFTWNEDSCTYTLVNANSGLCLGVKDGSKQKQANVWQNDFGLGSRWHVTPLEGNAVLISNYNSRLHLSVQGNSKQKQANVWQYHKTVSSLWRLQRLDDEDKPSLGAHI